LGVTSVEENVHQQVQVEMMMVMAYLTVEDLIKTKRNFIAK
jgi:hypothetical protein